MCCQACPKSTTKDGFELQIGTNHIGHFYLVQLLLPKMKKQVGCCCCRRHSFRCCSLPLLLLEQAAASQPV